MGTIMGVADGLARGARREEAAELASAPTEIAEAPAAQRPELVANRAGVVR